MNFPLLSYIKNVIMPICIVSILSVPLPLIVNNCVHPLWLNLLTVGTTSIIVSTSIMYTVGLKTEERNVVKKLFIDKFRR
jgi:hypothetical protein